MAGFHSLLLTNDAGSVLRPIKTPGQFTYTKGLSNVGSWSLTMPVDKTIEGLIAKDRRVEFWRRTNTAKPTLDYVGFILRKSIKTTKAGKDLLTISGPDQNDLVRRRIIAYPGGTDYAEKYGAADNLMKAFVREQMTVSATDETRRLATVDFAVDADLTLGPVIGDIDAPYSVPYRVLQDVLNELSDRSRTAGTPLYWSISTATEGQAFRFQVFATIPGVDRTYPYSSTLLIPESSLSEPEAITDWSESISSVYAGGPGDDIDRTVFQRRMMSRQTESRFGRTESFLSADVEDDDDLIKAAGDAELAARRPVRTIETTIVDTAKVQYLQNWDLGDKLSLMYRGQQYDGLVTVVTVSVDEGGDETVEASLLIEPAVSSEVVDIIVTPDPVALLLRIPTPVVTA